MLTGSQAIREANLRAGFGVAAVGGKAAEKLEPKEVAELIRVSPRPMEIVFRFCAVVFSRWCAGGVVVAWLRCVVIDVVDDDAVVLTGRACLIDKKCALVICCPNPCLSSASCCVCVCDLSVTGIPRCLVVVSRPRWVVLSLVVSIPKQLRAVLHPFVACCLTFDGLSPLFPAIVFEASDGSIVDGDWRAVFRVRVLCMSNQR